MFRIWMHALWSRDYVGALVRLLVDTLHCTLDDAKAIVVGLAEGVPKDIICATPGHAYDLSTDLLQFGVFTSVEQVGAVTDAAIVEDSIRTLTPDMGSWLVYIDPEGKARRAVQQDTLGFLTFERQEVMEAVAEEMLMRGATPISKEQMDQIVQAANEAREERVRYAKMMASRHGRNWKQILYEIRQGIRPPLEEE